MTRGRMLVGLDSTRRKENRRLVTSPHLLITAARRGRCLPIRAARSARGPCRTHDACLAEAYEYSREGACRGGERRAKARWWRRGRRCGGRGERQRGRGAARALRVARRAASPTAGYTGEIPTRRAALVERCLAERGSNVIAEVARGPKPLRRQAPHAAAPHAPARQQLALRVERDSATGIRGPGKGGALVGAVARPGRQAVVARIARAREGSHERCKRRPKRGPSQLSPESGPRGGSIRCRTRRDPMAWRRRGAAQRGRAPG